MWATATASQKITTKHLATFIPLTLIRQTLRTGGPTDESSGNANGVLSCKSPDVARVIEERGEDGYFEGKWARLGNGIINPDPAAVQTVHDTQSEGFKNTMSQHWRWLSSLTIERAFETIGKKFDEQSRLDQQASVVLSATWNTTSRGQQGVKFPWDRRYNRCDNGTLLWCNQL